MSLYNKYRPKSFDDLIQSKYSKGLTDNLSHHAYLFFGPPGTGKTSSARLCMANVLGEISEKDLSSVIDGRHPDYVEINCAVNNGVDDVRTIVSDVVNTMPVQSEYKFIIFDECHMLTTQAQNALLKTVEEPPRHIKFFFCTTEINKVLPAIRSRCQIIPFIKLSDQSLFIIVKTICDGEKIKYSESSAKLIASSSDGSARSAINLTEQCLSIMEDDEAVAQVLGTSSAQNFYNLTKSICDKDNKNSVNLLEDIFNNSIDPGSVMNKYADYVAELIVKRINNSESCEFEGKKLLLLADCITDILKDFKILQNIKLISKLHILKLIQKL